MSRLVHSVANRAAALFMRVLFGYSSRVYTMGHENADQTGGFLLACNHISHFDPFIISSVVRRKIDWMAMAEFFPLPVVGLFLRAVDAFPVERNRADLKTIRTAIERLKNGRVVGIFPEGGIRDGARSLLEGAPLRPGTATLAQIAGVPIVPCVILGSDRFYSKKQWLPFRRTRVWIAFGKPISGFPELEKLHSRERIESTLAGAFKNLFAELREKFSLSTDDLPHAPRERCHPERRRGSPLQDSVVNPRDSSTSLCGACPERSRRARNDRLRRVTARTIDSLLCASINFLQRRHRLNGHTREEMERYITTCERLSPLEYYAAPQTIAGNSEPELKHAFDGVRDSRISKLAWRSPI